MRIAAICFSAMATAAMVLLPSVQAAEPGIDSSQPPPQIRELRRNCDDLHFAVIGDRTGLARPGVFEQAVKQAGWLRPDFILNIGDILEGYTQNPSDIEREWAEADRTLSFSRVPFLLVPGNHDLSNEAMLAAWKARRGNPFYAFVFKDALFIILDTEDPPHPMPPAMARGFQALANRMRTDPTGAERQLRESPPPSAADLTALKKIEAPHIGHEQVEFVRKTLARHPHVRWTFLLMHKPAWKSPSPNFLAIERLLADRPYTVIAGHTHYYEGDVRHGRDYIVMGTTGAVPAHEGPGAADRILWVSLPHDQPPSIATIGVGELGDKQGNSGQPEADLTSR